MSSAPKSFCVAPWLESVLYNDGTFRICSRNHRSFGNWKQDSLSKLWNSNELKEFRKEIAAGKFPDQDCKACYDAGSSQTFRRILNAPATNAIRDIWESNKLDHSLVAELEKIPQLFESWNLELNKRFLEILTKVEHPAARKLEKLLRVVKSFHESEPNPEVVGPFRQVQLISKCNARCVMCPGNFTGELENGDSIEEKSIANALDRNEDILDFFCNGSEFLLFKGWRQIAANLAAGGCQSLRISTNGMLLTEENAKYLVDHRVISHFNVSLNAASHDNLERIQKNVRFLRMKKNVEFFLAYAEEKKIYFPMSFSFILLRSNFHELSLYLEMIHEFTKYCDQIKPHALIMSLENAGLSGYRSFLFEEHPDFMSLEERNMHLRKAQETASRLGIKVELYNFGSSKDFKDLISEGIPGFVPLSVDQESVEALTREALDPIWEKFYLDASQTISSWFNREKFPLGNTFFKTGELSKSLIVTLEKALEEANTEIPHKLRYVCARYPQHLEMHRKYARHYANALKVRLAQQIEIFQQNCFKQKTGFNLEELRDHRGETILPLDPTLIAPGSRVLGKDQKEYIFWDSKKMVTLEDPLLHEALQYHPEFLEGVFVFDEPVLLDGTQEHAWVGKSLTENDKLVPGSEIICWNEDSWIYLHGAGNVIYLSPKNSESLHILPTTTLNEAYLWRMSPLSTSKEKLRQTALKHSRWNELKNKIIGNRKSKLLWKLSLLYRARLSKKGISMPSDLVIKTAQTDELRDQISV